MSDQENAAIPQVSATEEEIEEWDKHHDEPHPVFRVDHRPERESVGQEVEDNAE